VDDVELLFKELGLHLTHDELRRAFSCIPPAEWLTIEQVKSVYAAAQN